MSNYKWAAIIEPVGLRSRFKIGELVRCSSKSDETMIGSWISYGEIGLVKRLQFFKREKIVDDKVEIKAYPSIICEVEVYWMTKSETAWILESLLERLDI